MIAVRNCIYISTGYELVIGINTGCCYICIVTTSAIKPHSNHSSALMFPSQLDNEPLPINQAAMVFNNEGDLSHQNEKHTDQVSV